MTNIVYNHSDDPSSVPYIRSLPNGAVRVEGICSECGEKSLYMMRENPFSGKIFCYSCETCSLCYDSCHGERLF